MGMIINPYRFAANGPITFRSSNIASSEGANSLTLNAPSGLTNGDCMVAVIFANVATTTITPPSGWNLIISDVIQTTANISAYYKIASGESGNYQFNLSASVRVSGCITSFYNVSALNTINKSGVDSTSVAPSITTDVNGCMLITSHAVDGSTNVSYWDPPSGYTEAADTNSKGSCCMTYKLQSTAGSSGTANATCYNDIGSKVSLHIALKPA